MRILFSLLLGLAFLQNLAGAQQKFTDIAYIQIFGLPEKNVKLFIEGVEIPTSELEVLQTDDGLTYSNIQFKNLVPKVYYRVKVRVDDDKNQVTKGSVLHVRGNQQLAVYFDEMKKYSEASPEGNLSLNYDVSKKSAEKELPDTVEISAGNFVSKGTGKKPTNSKPVETKAILKIFVPTVASKLLIDGKLTDTTGQDREMEFEFGPMEKEKTVAIEVEYTDAEGVLTSKKKKVTLKPGQKETLRFTDNYYPKK